LSADNAAPLLSVTDLHVHFPIRAGILRRRVGALHAVDGISFEVRRGETLGLVGESGCGKSTTGLALMGLVPASAGRVLLEGEEVGALKGAARRRSRRRMQIIFQDPFSSLNPRRTAHQSIRAPLDIHRIGDAGGRDGRARQLMARVGLRADQAELFPHEFSGGQRQRIGIARALALEPDLLICDEPVSALDVSVQAQVLNLLADLQRDLGVAYLLISHDLRVVEHISQRVAVMYLGRIVEIAATPLVFAKPLHPYTELLLGAAPSLDPRKRRGFPLRNDDVPSATARPSGCAFHPRCPLATELCRRVDPPLSARDDGRWAACHHR
jgi:peptide/nickel transport system ATP-binding protein